MPAPIKVDRDRLTALTADGWSVEQLAEHFRVHPATISRLRSRLGISTKRTMTAERKAVIGSMLDDGWSFAEVSRTEGADHETLRKYFPGRQWSMRQRDEYRAVLRLGDAGHFNRRQAAWKRAA